MTAAQRFRLALVTVTVIAIQTTAFDTFLLFGVAHLLLPMWLVVGIGRRLPPTNAALFGFWVGLAWDAASVEAFGKHALAMTLVGLLAARSARWTEHGDRRLGFATRIPLMVAATVVVWLVAALAGERFPSVDPGVASGLALSSILGAAVAGPSSWLVRAALPTRLRWERVEVSPTWSSRRAGLHAVEAPAAERARAA